jgi:cell division septation protein DedD
MDEALKARLIGAAVLVALAVLLIPELLSGRKPAGGDAGLPPGSRGTRTFTIELGGGADPAPASTSGPAALQVPAATAGPARAAQAPPATTGTDAGPVPAATSPADSVAMPGTAAATAGVPTAAQAAPLPHPGPAGAASAPTPPARPPVTTSPARGGWAVQVGAFGSVATAEKMADQLRSAGYRAYLSPVQRSGKTLTRVRVGPEAERARAEGLAASLKARGLPATVVAND